MKKNPKFSTQKQIPPVLFIEKYIWNHKADPIQLVKKLENLALILFNLVLN